MSPSAREIHELNIRHYRKLLETDSDVLRRQTIAVLLKKEEVGLAKLDRALKRGRVQPSPPSRASGTD